MNIFVASLPFQLEEVDVKRVFENYGEVSSVKLITDRETGKRKGFGFVVMPNDEDALKAIKALNGKELLQRKISVSKAEDRGGNNSNTDGFPANKRSRGQNNYNQDRNRDRYYREDN